MKLIRGILIAFVLMALAAGACAEPSLCPYDIHLSITYNYLSAPERALFDRMYDAIRTGADSVDVPAGVTREQAETMIDFILNEAAELCAYDRWNTRVTGSGGDLKVKLAYKMPISAQDAFIQTAAKEARSYAGKSESAGIRAIHDGLIRRFAYGNVDGEDTQLAYYALKNGKAVCNGYAQTAALFAHFAGYSCSYITGYVENDGKYDAAHAWNVACADGRFLWFDATWDDAGSKAIDQWYGLDGVEMAASHRPLPRYDAVVPLKTMFPNGVTATMYLDVNTDAGFVRGITDKSGKTVLLRDLKSGEFYTPALVVWNEGSGDFKVRISYSLDGVHRDWGSTSSVPRGSNIAFRTNARPAGDAKGSHEIVWYADGMCIGSFTWKAK